MSIGFYLNFHCKETKYIQFCVYPLETQKANIFDDGQLNSGILHE